MSQTILILIGIVIVALLLTRKGRQTAVGMCATALDQTVRKNVNKEKAVSFFREKGHVSNAELREALGISERSAVRYMDELEKEGKVEQVGNTGRGVTYRLKH